MSDDRRKELEDDPRPGKPDREDYGDKDLGEGIDWDRLSPDEEHPAEIDWEREIPDKDDGA